MGQIKINILSLHQELSKQAFTMARVQALIRANDKATEANVRFRLRDGRYVDLFYKSDIKINPKQWDAKKECIKAKVVMLPSEKNAIDKTIREHKELLISAYQNVLDGDEEKTSKNLSLNMDKLLYPNRYKTSLDNINSSPNSFFDLLDYFIEINQIAGNRKRHYESTKRMLMRFEKYVQLSIRNFKLDINKINADTLRDFENYLFDEVEICEQYPQILDRENNVRAPKQKGGNTINGIFRMVRTFILWSIKEGITTNNPFIKYKIPEAIYGTPYYITIEERNKLFNCDFSNRPGLAIQRDIFVFHCLIGCRVGDLIKLTKSNVIGPTIEYIATKTKEGDPRTIVVPLNYKAKEILNKYKDLEGEKLLPFISEQKYNDSIKDMFKMAGLNRVVTILNPTTRISEQKPLYKVASSHLARRTFIGNLYKQVQDPSLIGALSGHVEGSRAFARYREIDIEMKKDLVDLLD